MIYHYFPSKDAIIHVVYDRICALKRAKLLEGYGPQLDAREAFVGVFVRAYAFYRNHLREMYIPAQYESAVFRTATDAERPPDDERMAFERRFRSKAKSAVLNDLPELVLYELTLGLATAPRQAAEETDARDAANCCRAGLGVDPRARLSSLRPRAREAASKLSKLFDIRYEGIACRRRRWV